jgi:hypothetical protein
MVGPDACKQAAAKAGPGKVLSAADLASLTGGVGAADAKGLASKGLAMALDKIPGGSAIRRALEGVKALRDGDASKALQLAAELIPMPGPAKMALRGAAKVAENLPPIPIGANAKGNRRHG